MYTLFGALAATALTPALSYSQTSNCNNLDRTPTTEGGKTTTSEVDCPDITLTFEILGQSVTLSTPDKCPTGTRDQDSDCFNCATPAPGNHCLSNQFTVNVEICTIDDPCPSGPDSIPGSLAEFRRSMSCTPPNDCHDEEVGCSSANPCGQTGSTVGHAQPITSATSYVHGQRRDGSTAFYTSFRTTWSGALENLPAAQPTELDELRDRIERVPYSQLPEALAGLGEDFLPKFGVSGLSARVSEEWIDADGSQHEQQHVHGTFLADGNFSLIAPEQSATGKSLIKELAFDGATLFAGTIGAEAYQAITASFAGHDTAVLAKVGPLRHLRAWSSNPFELLRLPESEYTVVPLSDTTVQVTEAYPVPTYPEWAGTTVHTLEKTDWGYRPTRTEIYSGRGMLLERRDYGDYRSIHGAIWRPCHVKESRFREGSEIPYYILNTEIQATGAVYHSRAEASEGMTYPEPASGWWIIHE